MILYIISQTRTFYNKVQQFDTYAASCYNLLKAETARCDNMRNQETTGTVISVKTQWWLKVNTKPVRIHAMDGARFPHIIKVRYTVNDQTYIKRKWIPYDHYPPSVGSAVTVLYDENKPSRAKII